MKKKLVAMVMALSFVGMLALSVQARETTEGPRGCDPRYTGEMTGKCPR